MKVPLPILQEAADAARRVHVCAALRSEDDMPGLPYRCGAGGALDTLHGAVEADTTPEIKTNCGQETGNQIEPGRI